MAQDGSDLVALKEMSCSDLVQKRDGPNLAWNSWESSIFQSVSPLGAHGTQFQTHSEKNIYMAKSAWFIAWFIYNKKKPFRRIIQTLFTMNRA